MNQACQAKPVRVRYPNGTESVFPSKNNVSKHFNIRWVQLQRSLVSGKPVSMGPRKGFSFSYVD